jgi:long-chain fatty acid transport protein
MNQQQRLVAALLAALSGSAQAAGFALIEQNASGLGNAYAGAAAVAEDASTVYFNPAGMALLPERQVVMAGHFIRPSSEYSGIVTPNIGGGDGGDAGGWAFVPNFYYTHRLTPAITAGIGVNAPFGLKTEYDKDWMGRYQAIKSEVKTINVNPSIAWKINEQFSVGAGVSIQYIEATLTSYAGRPGTAKVKGDDYGWGFNLGALWQPTPATRVGLSYRSEIDYTLDGDASFSDFSPANGDIEADTTLPDSASLSLFHKLGPRWELLADITWTGWSDFEELAIYYKNGPLLSYTPEEWDDILRYSLGATWHMDDKLSLRAGLAYDEAPVSDKYRTPRIPDGARTWVAIGGQYRVSRQGVLDFGYAHLFVEDSDLNSPAPGTIPFTPVLTGSYDNSVDIISFQYTHTF